MRPESNLIMAALLTDSVHVRLSAPGKSLAVMIRSAFLCAALLLFLSGEGCSPAGNQAPASSGAAGGAAGNSGGSGGNGSGGNGGGSSGGTGGTGGGTGGSAAGGTGGGTGGGAPIPDAGGADTPVEAGPLPVCDYPQWKAGMHYNVGDIVMYMGKAYITTNANDGLDPTISTFFWSPYAGCMPPPPPGAVPCPILDRLAPAGQTTFQASYDAMFAAPFQGQVIHPSYTYDGLCQALNTPALAPFVRSNDLLQDRREIAAFFANVAVETAYLAYADEGGAAPTVANFHGRGSLQITGQAIY
jgi:hypothetical protein